MKTLFELLKSVLKITGAIILIYSVVWDSIPQIVGSAALPVYGSALLFNDFLVKVIIRVGIFFLIVAVADLIYQKKNFAKEMKMEKFEVKQEYKDTEGDPQIKGKRRELFREIAYQDGPRAAKRARMIITNPTHYSVALKYDMTNMSAPILLASGTDLVALKIREIATWKYI